MARSSVSTLDGISRSRVHAPERPAAFNLFAFIVPTVLYALYFAALEIWGGGIWWTIHLWAGAIFLAGIVGLPLSYAMLPPRVEAM